MNEYERKAIKGILKMKNMPANEQYYWSAVVMVIRDALIENGTFESREDFDKQHAKYFLKLQEKRSTTIEKKASTVKFRTKKTRKRNKNRKSRTSN